MTTIKIDSIKRFFKETKAGMYKLRDWIKEDKLYWNLMCYNPKAIRYLEKNLTRFVGIFYVGIPRPLLFWKRTKTRLYGI